MAFPSRSLVLLVTASIFATACSGEGGDLDGSGPSGDSFVCDDSISIPYSWVCDGDNDCAGAEDEAACGEDAGDVEVDLDADAGSDTSSDTSPDTGPDPAVVERILIEPAGALLEVAGAEVELTAVAYNALGDVIEADVTWKLSETDAIVAVEPGRYSATDIIGSAQVSAVVGDVVSAPVPVVNARVAPEVVRYDDSALVELDVLDSADADGAVMVATFAPDKSFEVGDVIVGSGSDGVVGRVVAISTGDTGVEVLLAPVTLSDLFSEFTSSGTVDLGALAAAEAAPDEKRRGISCSTGGDSIGSNLVSLNVTNLSRFTSYPSLSWTLDDSVSEVRIQGRLGVDLGAAITLGFTPGLDWSCSAEMYALPIPILPLPWSLGFVVEAPMGLRVDIEASAEAADVTASVTASTGLDIDLGVRCEREAECFTYDDVSLVPTVWRPEVDGSAQLQVEATAFAGAYANIWAGVPIVTRPRSERPGLTLASGRGGTLLRFVKAGVQEQLTDADLAAKISLETGWSVSVGASNELIDDVFGISGELFSASDWEDWLRTPTGMLQLRNTVPACGAPDEPILGEGCALDVSVLWDDDEGTTDLSSVLGWRLYQQDGERWVQVGEAGAAEALRWTPSADDVAAGRVTFGAVYSHAWLPRDSSQLEIRDDSRVTLRGTSCPANLPEPGDGFVRITAGTFTMGSPSDEVGRYNNESLVEVTLTRDFWLQTTEVTQGAWMSLMDYNPSCSQTTTGHYFVEGCTTGNANPNGPVEFVSWFDAIRYANARSRAEGLPECYDALGNVIGGATAYDCCGYRLPTEAEWEYAARAGTTTATYRGNLSGNPLFCDSQPNLDPIAWYCGNAGFWTHAVGTRSANAWGLHDMLGNVSEWTHDWYSESASGGIDPWGPASGSDRVSRGGSWRNNDGAGIVRASYRKNLPNGARTVYNGFRLARTAP